MHINWYPGHMKKTKELIQENLKLVDVVIELLDARIPMSSRNPQIDELVERKPRVVALNKSDLADPQITRKWVNYFAAQGINAVPVNSMTGEGLDKMIALVEEAAKEKMDALINKGMRKRAVRSMIVGIPNVGKSSIINRLTGKKSAKTGDKPGVTKGKQWVRLRGNIELLDTPGILWPKFENQQVGLKLAFTGAIKDEILDIETIALHLVAYLVREYTNQIKERYKLSEIFLDNLENLERIAKNRGCIFSGGRIDYSRAANLILDEFRSGKIGKITLEKPEDYISTIKA
ncbi:ribosome biogenesis GTPase A [Geosporobacter subterraneus DSM 17957]|uniref:Ribosome biogenesis GTPase A n=1 Tax=Geosporobacter subterraneus DSM 17957 TaxID=1121919 RepID=A0A1M6E661_9FIRM|nr:ribosome biogenesis GTPase YlqF [Geosporobacter subterraneus]SHI80931.1 ribosome biogenesis GTPase A [Geosporobacter subterraneus DSM 17957]